jgi:hypothetical protein
MLISGNFNNKRGKDIAQGRSVHVNRASRANTANTADTFNMNAPPLT